MSRRNKPKTPRDFSEQAAERREREREIARLQAQGVTVKTDPAKRIISAYRSNVFRLFLDRKTITLDQHNAADWLCEVWAEWKGLDGGPEQRVEGVSGSGELEPPETGYIRAKRQAQAGNLIAWIVPQIEPDQWKLLRAFIVATVEEDRVMMWRGVVERETGETRRDHQGPLVVAALESLRAVYQEPKEKAA